MKVNALHETFTDESNSVIKINELLNHIKSLPLEEQAELLKKIIELSEEVNNNYKKSIKEHKEFMKKRKLTKVEKRKVIHSKKAKVEQKTYFTEAINEHEDEIKQIIKLSFEDFKIFIDALKDFNEKQNFLILGLIKELNIYNKFADEAYINKDIELLNEIRTTSKEIQEKIDYLKQKGINKTIVSDKKTIRVIFLETSSGRSYFMKDVKGNNEYYESFSYLLSAIEEGNPKNVKHLDGNNELKGTVESKDIEGKTRIFFDKLDENTYVVYNAIIKKDDNSTSYRNQAIRRYKYYLDQKRHILSQMNNADFIERQNAHLEEVKSLFYQSKEKTKNLIPVKGGEV